MKKILIVFLIYLALDPNASWAQTKNHLTTNLLSTLSSKKNIGLTYHRELTQNFGIQITLFHNFRLGQRISFNDEFVPEFTYSLKKSASNLGGECTLYVFKNRIGIYAGYERVQVNKHELFCLDGTDLGNGFYDCKEIHTIDYQDGVNIVQSGVRLRLPLPIDPGHMSLHLRPVYAYFWSDTDPELPVGPDAEGRAKFSKNLGHWNNNLLFFNKGSYLSIKLEVHVGISW